MPIKKRVCLLTGASGSFGHAFCQRFAPYYDIAAVFNTRQPRVSSNLVRVVDPLNPQDALDENSHQIFAIRADLFCRTAQSTIVDMALARFSKIDLVIHAAMFTRWADLVGSDKAIDSFEKQLFLNAFAPLNISTYLIRESWMQSISENAERNRNIITLSSTAAHTVYAGRGQSIYSASKAALNILTKHMASEFRTFGVRVNAVAPDTFVSRTPLDTVLNAISSLDEGVTTGEIVTFA
jgi:NAD(P)-dependent dehydrogenase (short-subunit alcohol dehydrogenase family)